MIILSLEVGSKQMVLNQKLEMEDERFFQQLKARKKG
jgi:hypothetical protein